MTEFRLIVNKSIRIALVHDARSRSKLTRLAYASLSQEHQVYRQYLPSAFEVALATLKAWRRRKGVSRQVTPPFLRRPLLKAENQSYSLNRNSGVLRIPIRAREACEIHLTLSEWHRSFLSDPSWSLGSLTLVPGRAILALRKVAPATGPTKVIVAIDTNERSLDGVIATKSEGALVTISMSDVVRVQRLHAKRRSHLARKKAHDQRVKRKLLKHEGQRERARVLQRLHLTSKRLVRFAQLSEAAIVLENLTKLRPGGSTPAVRRRLTSWPRGELHRQIEYKAALAGVPVIKVNPAWTSKTCPVCGARRRDRVGQDFVCSVCDWEMDRQHNAACNILLSALASNEALARGVRFHPGALRQDVVSPLCDLPALLGGAREEPSGVEPHALSAWTEPSLSKRHEGPA